MRLSPKLTWLAATRLLLQTRNMVEAWPCFGLSPAYACNTTLIEPGSEPVQCKDLRTKPDNFGNL